MSHGSWEFFLCDKSIKSDKRYIRIVKEGIQICGLFERAIAVHFLNNKLSLSHPGVEQFFRLKHILKELQKNTQPRQLFDQFRKTKNFLKKLAVSGSSQDKDEIQEYYKFLEVLYAAISKIVARCMYRQRNPDCLFPL